MRKTHIHSLDLQLLHALKALLEEKNVSRAAAKIGISQSAMSRCLARLRELLDDQILVRITRGFALTPRAEGMLPQLDDLIRRAEKFFYGDQFNPKESDGLIRLALSDYGAIIFLPKIFERLSKEAPNLKISVSTWSENIYEQFDAGNLDIAIGVAAALPLHLHKIDLFCETPACLVRKGHPIIKSKMTPENYLRYGHVNFATGKGSKSMQDSVQKRLQPYKKPRKISLTIPYFLAAAAVVAETDLILSAPSRLAARMCKMLPLVHLPMPVPMDHHPYNMIWPDRLEEDKLNTWVRRLIIEIADEIKKEKP